MTISILEGLPEAFSSNAAGVCWVVDPHPSISMLADMLSGAPTLVSCPNSRTFLGGYVLFRSSRLGCQLEYAFPAEEMKYTDAI